ncbi:MAG TPA: hypothetical protein VNN06_01580 [Ramlibacter sp.]|nr:hypothetical protein [Ramlibacter sp.]
MAQSSILGADFAPNRPSGRGADVLGPSDNSDSGSDAVGTDEIHEDSDAAGTGERGSVAGSEGREGGDILPDRVKRLQDGDGVPEADQEGDEFSDLDAREFTDLDTDDQDQE